MNSAAELSAVEPENQLITFEQPLTERMRTLLRVELLHEQTLFHVEDPTDFGARSAVTGFWICSETTGRKMGSQACRNFLMSRAASLAMP